MKQNLKGKKIFVGLSGGVDSSVSAALLLRAGADVTGVFIKGWYPSFIDCDWKNERRDAMRVAAHLGIPFLTCDAENAYKQHVVDYMVSEYKAGRTPNPDVMCNKYVKFGVFFDFAIEHGADYIATGHYARALDGVLHTGKDESKDQSYFLWAVPKLQLEKTLFPVGEIEKKEVRSLAKKYKLFTSEKKDSQGLCFLGKVDLDEFLSNYIPKKKGNVINEDGEVIGVHDGAHLYTLGERHGFIITKKDVNDEPYYIVEKDTNKNTITVAHKMNLSEGLLVSAVVLREVNWTIEPKEGKTYECRWRYRQSLSQCLVSQKDGSCVVAFSTSQEYVPAGQSLVLYEGEV